MKKKIVLEIIFFYFPENYSRRVRKATNKKFWPKLRVYVSDDKEFGCSKALKTQRKLDVFFDKNMAVITLENNGIDRYVVILFYVRGLNS